MKEKTRLQQLICQCRVGSVQQKANAIVELEEMGEMGDQQAIPALLELLDFPDAAIRASAAEALGTLADLADSIVASALLRLLNDPDLLVRANTAEALGLLDYSESAYELMRTLQSDKDALVRLCAAEALGRLGKPSTLPALLDALSDSDGGVRAYAADAIGALGSSAEVFVLRQKLSSERSPDVKAFILSALYRLGDDRAFISLVALLEHADESLTTLIENLIDHLATAQNAATTWDSLFMPLTWRQDTSAIRQVA